MSPTHEDLREAMVERQIAARGVCDRAVLAAMRAIPRERFVAPDLAGSAYDDRPLPIGEDQTISQPYIVAAMIEAARIEPGDKVLEVGTGSGYAAAVLSRVAGTVFTIERHSSLAGEARLRLAGLGCANVTVVVGDGSAGLPGEAPFAAILVAARSPQVPEALERQLALGGRLLIPIGSELVQRLCRITRTAEDAWTRDDLGAVRFVRLVGQQGGADPA